MMGRGIGSAFRESGANLRNFDRWATLAWIDTSLRYRRTMLGPWWMTLSTGVMIGSVGLVWGAIFNTDLATYMPYFAVGIVLWTLISASLTEGCNVFTQAGRLIKSLPVPLMVHVHRMLARQLIVLAHNAILIVALWAVFRWPLGWSALLALPGLAILTISMTGGVLILGVLCTRFRDVPQIIGAILQLMFLLTPIMWVADSIRGKSVSFLIEANPFFYLVEIVRAPLLGHPPEAHVWLVACVIALVSLVAGHAIYGRFRHRIAYWL